MIKEGYKYKANRLFSSTLPDGTPYFVFSVPDNERTTDGDSRTLGWFTIYVNGRCQIEDGDEVIIRKIIGVGRKQFRKNDGGFGTEYRVYAEVSKYENGQSV